MVEMALSGAIIRWYSSLAIIDWRYYVYTYQELENAARRGSEWAYTSPPTTIPMLDDNTGDKCARLIKKGSDGAYLSQRPAAFDNINRARYPDPAKNSAMWECPIQVQVELYRPLADTIRQQDLWSEYRVFRLHHERTIVNITPPVRYE